MVLSSPAFPLPHISNFGLLKGSADKLTRFNRQQVAFMAISAKVPARLSNIWRQGLQDGHGLGGAAPCARCFPQRPDSNKQNRASGDFDEVDLVIQQILAAGTKSALKEADLRRERSMTNLVFELDHGPKHREEWRPVDFDPRRVPLDARFPTRQLSILEHVFDPPWVFELDSPKRAWIAHQLQPLRTLKEISVKFSQDQREDILPESSMAHIARLRVDSVFRHGFDIWEVHGFQRLCAQVDEATEPGAQVDCVEYLRRVTDGAEKLRKRLDADDIDCISNEGHRWTDEALGFWTTKLGPRETGLPMAVFAASAYGTIGPQLKVAQDYGYKACEVGHWFSMTIEDHPRIRGDTGAIRLEDLTLVQKFVRLNKDLLLAVWNARGDEEDERGSSFYLVKNIRSVPIEEVPLASRKYLTEPYFGIAKLFDDLKAIKDEEGALEGDVETERRED